MPEGDTIFRAARSLRLMLQGKIVLAASAASPDVDAASLIGRVISEVEARGKNLLIHFDDARILHTHMKMDGSWHIYRPAEAPRRTGRSARVVLEVEGAVAICFRAPLVVLTAPRELSRHVISLGPDLLGESFDFDAGLARFRAHDDLPLGEVVMMQNVVAGIGNIYKSETLFACRFDPFANVARFTDDELRTLLENARTFMKSNLDSTKRSFRITGEAGRVWVYRRQGDACLRCGTTIAMRRQGDLARSTYFCALCQPARRT